MTTIECKKTIEKKLKELLNKSVINDAQFIYSKKGFECSALGQKTGLVEIKYLTGSHIPYGALTAITISCVIAEGLIWDLMNRLNLSFRKSGIFHDFVFRLFSSNLNNEAFFKSHGVIAFYPNDNIDTKAIALADNIKLFFFNPLSLIATGKPEAITEIVHHPERFGYPATTAMIIYDLNHQPNLFDGFLQQVNKNKLPDAAPNKIAEVKEKLLSVTPDA